MKSYQVTYRQLQLVFGAMNRRLYSTGSCLAYFFERASCALFVFFSVKIIQQLGQRHAFHFIVRMSNLVFACSTTSLQFTLANIISMTLESIEFRRSFLAQKLQFRKQHILFMKSCPPFQATLGGCLRCNNELSLSFTNDFTLNLVLTLLLR